MAVVRSLSENKQTTFKIQNHFPPSHFPKGLMFDTRVSHGGAHGEKEAQRIPIELKSTCNYAVSMNLFLFIVCLKFKNMYINNFHSVDFVAVL